MKSSAPTPTNLKVKIFITHNGDLDFFRVGTKFYDLHTVQLWLEKATGFPMPASVDSAAIADLVDLISTAGSFGLSARSSFLLGSKSSKIDTQQVLPSREDFEQVGELFDTALHDFSKSRVALFTLSAAAPPFAASSPQRSSLSLNRTQRTRCCQRSSRKWMTRNTDQE